MRLVEFKLRQYRVLRNFEVSFEGEVSDRSTYALDLIVGVNGTGKSTLLRVLAELFQTLDSSSPLPTFDFFIRYQLYHTPDNPFTVTIETLVEGEQDGMRERRLHCKVVDLQGVVLDGLVDRVDKAYLPPLVVAFTSGSEREWLQDAQQPGNLYTGLSLQLPDPTGAHVAQQLADWYLRELAGKPVEEYQQGEDRPLDSIFLFIQERHLPLVILCGLLVDMIDTPLDQPEQGKRLQDALNEAKIKALRGFSLRFRMNREVIARDDYAFIRDLSALAAYTVQMGSDYLVVFDLQSPSPSDQPDSERIRQLTRLLGDGLQLFRRLAALVEPGEDQEAILREVNLFLERDYSRPGQAAQARLDGEHAAEQEHPPLHLLEWLSDGEISFLGRVCLLSLLRSREALILLDEPEVHFNDYWKRELVNMLDQSLHGQYSHVLMTTHSSITLSDVYNTDILILKRGTNFTERAVPPSLRTLGADPSDIIVHVFEAQSAIGSHSITSIQNSIREAQALENVAERRRRLDRLEKQVGPSPWRFLIRRELYALEDVQS